MTIGLVYVRKSKSKNWLVLGVWKISDSKNLLLSLLVLLRKYNWLQSSAHIDHYGKKNAQESLSWVGWMSLDSVTSVRPMGNRELAQLGIIIGHWNIRHAIKELHKCGILSFHMKTRGVSHCGLCHFKIKTRYLKAKEEFWKLKYFTMQKYNLQKVLYRNQNRSRYYNFITNLNTSKNIICQKSSNKIDLLLSRGQNPLSYYIL